jgi:hypothetical protein
MPNKSWDKKCEQKQEQLANRTPKIKEKQQTTPAAK